MQRIARLLPLSGVVFVFALALPQFAFAAYSASEAECSGWYPEKPARFSL